MRQKKPSSRSTTSYAPRLLLVLGCSLATIASGQPHNQSSNPSKTPLDQTTTINQSDVEEYSKKYGLNLPLGQQVDAAIASGSICKIESLMAKQDQKDPKALMGSGSLVRTLVLLHSVNARENIPSLTVRQVNTLQRNLFRKNIAKYPGIEKDYLTLETLRQVELSLGNLVAYDTLFEQNLQNHRDLLHTDIDCHRFLHDVFQPSKKMPYLMSKFQKCRSSDALPYFKKRAAIAKKCLEKNGKPYASLQQFTKDQRAGC